MNANSYARLAETFSMGEASFAEVRQQFENRVQAGELIEVENRSPGRAFTTGENDRLRAGHPSRRCVPDKTSTSRW